MTPLTPEQFERLERAVEESYSRCANCGDERYATAPYLYGLYVPPAEFRHVNPTAAAELKESERVLVQIIPVFCGCGHVTLFSVSQLLGGETPGVPDLRVVRGGGE